MVNQEVLTIRRVYRGLGTWQDGDLGVRTSVGGQLVVREGPDIWSGSYYVWGLDMAYSLTIGCIEGLD